MRKTSLILIGCIATAMPMSAKSQTTHDRQDGPTIIVDQATPAIFPESWHTSKINANAELVDDAELQRSRDIVARALAKYPAKVLSANLKAVYVLGRLEYSGVATGGTNSRNAVYVVNKPQYSSEVIEKILHAEFSSILLRNFPQHLDEEKWRQINPPDFRYRGSGVQAVREKQASNRFETPLHEEEFLNKYSQASIEEDFNSYAGRLLMGDKDLWDAIERYPKLKAKAELTIKFYGKLDSGFTKEFFLALRTTKSPANDAR